MTDLSDKQTHKAKARRVLHEARAKTCLATPERKAKAKAYRDTPEAAARLKARRVLPEYKGLCRDCRAKRQAKETGKNTTRAKRILT